MKLLKAIFPKMGLKGHDFDLSFWTMPKENIVITQPFLFSNKVLGMRNIHFSFRVVQKDARV